MDDNTLRKEEIMATGSSSNGDQQVHYTITETTVPDHRGVPQVCQNAKDATASTIAKPRGKYILLDPETENITNFASLTRQLNNSTPQPLLISRNRRDNSYDGNTEFYVDKSSISTIVRKSSSLTHVQESPEISNPEPYQDAPSSDTNMPMQYSHNEEETGSRSLVCRRQSVNSENDGHEENQVPHHNDGHEYSLQNGGTMTPVLQQQDITAHISGGHTPCSERPASRSSSTSGGSRHSTTIRPQLSNARVKKPSAAASSPQLRTSGPAHAPSRVPTEEDLLLLLMRRQRVRDHAYTRLLNDLHQLQAENQQLKSQGLDQDAKLVDMRSKWHDAVRETHLREADIRAFGDKYDKLKTWARDMHDAFASTRAEGSRLNDEVSHLKTEKEAQRSEINELLEKLEGISEPMSKFKETIAELRATSIELQTSRDLLGQAQNEMQDERLANKAHTLRIERLESDQQSTNTRFLKQQEEMQSSLSLVSGLLQKNDNGFLYHVVAELTNSVQVLRQDVATKTESSAQFSSILDATEQGHTKLSTILNSLAQAQVEQRTIQDLQDELNQLKGQHVAELANSIKLQLETATSLATSQNEVSEEKARVRKLQRSNTDAEKRLSDCVREFDQTEEHLSLERKRVEQLQVEKKKLEEGTRNVSQTNIRLEEEVSQLKADKERLEKIERLRVSWISIAYKSKIAALERNVEAHKTIIREKTAQVKGFENAREKYNTTQTHLQDNLTAARDEISTLKSTIETHDSRIKALKTDLDNAQISLNQIPKLENLVRLRETEIQGLSKDLDTSREGVKIKLANVLEKEKQIEQLRKEMSRITEESKTFSAAHEQCGEKDEQINILRIKNRDLAVEYGPLSILIKLLTDNEKMALDEKVVLGIKAMIQRQHERDRNTSERDDGLFVRPRRAANRDAQVDDEDMVVEDSQPPQHGNHIQDSSSGTGESDFLADDGFGPITNIRPSLVMGMNSRPVDIATGEDLRPATSNHEMLLRSSDTGIYPRAQSQATVLVPASSHEVSTHVVSPMRTRRGSQIRHGTPRTQSSADGERVVNYSTPPAHPRESLPSNSAAKRRQTSEAPESAAKRRVVNMKNLEIQTSRHSTASSTAQSSDSDNQDSSYELPVGGRRGMSTTASEISALRKTNKKATGTSRKNSKSAKMAAQFNAPAN